MNSKELSDRQKRFQRAVKAFPEFRYFDDPILFAPTLEASIHEGKEIGRRLGKILVRYHEIMGYGRGLAANQVGFPYSVFVTFLDNQIQTYINPVILKFSNEECFYRELCLSNKDKWGDIKRSVGITAQWLDTQGQTQQADLIGGPARIFQHETDHLIGVNSLSLAVTGSVGVCLSDPTKEVFRPA